MWFDYSPSVLSRYWLGIRKSIRPVKKLSDEVLVWLCDWSEVQIVCVMVMPLALHPPNPSSVASFKSRLVLPFWYRLTQVDQEKRPSKRCSSSSSWFDYHVSNGTLQCRVLQAYTSGGL